jgi:hypothetical protein
MYRLPRRMIAETFSTLRSCGANRRECQLYWISPWASPLQLTEVVHPKHVSGPYGLAIDSAWISSFWSDLAYRDLGVRVKVHTHPFEAFHSPTDDAYPLLFDPGFFSLVIPNFAYGPVGFQNAYLTEIQSDGSWREVEIAEKLHVHDD